MTLTHRLRLTQDWGFEDEEPCLLEVPLMPAVIAPVPDNKRSRGGGGSALH